MLREGGGFVGMQPPERLEPLDYLGHETLSDKGTRMDNDRPNSAPSLQTSTC